MSASAGAEPRCDAFSRGHSAAYSLFLQKQTPDALDVQSVQNSIAKSGEAGQKLVSGIDKLQTEYQKQLPSINKVETLERGADTLAIVNIERAQVAKVGELMNYVKTVDFSKLTDEQKTKIYSLSQEIQGFTSQITAAQIKLSND